MEICISTLKWFDSKILGGKFLSVTSRGVGHCNMSCDEKYGCAVTELSTLFQRCGKFTSMYVKIELHRCIKIKDYLQFDDNYHKRVHINKNEWVSFEVSQTHERTGEYRYKVLMNEVEQEAFSAINEKPRDFEHVGVYASDPWHPSFDGLIRNIEVCIAGKHTCI